MDILKYKEYEGTAEIDMDRMVCRGKILFIDDLVTFEANSPRDLQKAFEEAVDDYIETCNALGREAKKPLRGQFNVRVAPATHKAAVLRAVQDNVTLNEVVSRAVEAYVCATPTHNNVQVTFNVSQEQVETILTSTSSQPKWDTVNVH